MVLKNKNPAASLKRRKRGWGISFFEDVENVLMYVRTLLEQCSNYVIDADSWYNTNTVWIMNAVRYGTVRYGTVQYVQYVQIAWYAQYAQCAQYVQIVR